MAKAKKRPAEAWTYVLKADRELPRDEQSMFALAPMTYAQRAAVRDDMLRGERVFRSAGEIALRHIVSTENFPADNPAPWPTEHEKRLRYLEQLDDDDILEIGNEVWIRSTLGLDEETVKNSSPPGPTSSSGGTSTAAPTSTPVPAATETRT